MAQGPSELDFCYGFDTLGIPTNLFTPNTQQLCSDEDIVSTDDTIFWNREGTYRDLSQQRIQLEMSESLSPTNTTSGSKRAVRSKSLSKSPSPTKTRRGSLTSMKSSSSPKYKRIRSYSSPDNIQRSPARSPFRSESTIRDVVAMPDWIPNNLTKCHKLLDKLMAPTVECNFDLVMDKGFRYSDYDNAFIAQKKNHFQVSYTVSMNKMPSYVVTEKGVMGVASVHLNLHGVKLENPTEKVQLVQSSANRLREDFKSCNLLLSSDLTSRGSVQRLHFCSPTNNNQRRKGKPNPDQKYFSLVASVEVKTYTGETYCIASKRTPRLIIRASNPRQFSVVDEAMTGYQAEQIWSSYKFADGKANAALRDGPVGINVGGVNGDNALSVEGNVWYCGKLLRSPEPFLAYQKEDHQLFLSKLCRLDFASSVKGIGEELLPSQNRTLFSPNLNDVMPEAVVTQAFEQQDSSGSKIKRLPYAVDIEHLIYKTMGATRALAAQLDAAQVRIRQLEAAIGTHNYVKQER